MEGDRVRVCFQGPHNSQAVVSLIVPHCIAHCRAIQQHYTTRRSPPPGHRPHAAAHPGTPAEVAGRAVEQVREQAEERSSRPEGPARPLVDQPGPGDLFAPALPGVTPPEGAVPEPGGRERIALQLRVLDNGGNPRRTNEVVMSGHHATHHLTTHLRRRATARRFCDVL